MVKINGIFSSSSFIESKAIIPFLFHVPTAPPPVSIYSGPWEKAMAPEANSFPLPLYGRQSEMQSASTR